MIIWGSRGLTSELSRHHFHCPQCSVQREGALKQVRGFFTVYFIPLIPLNVRGRYVECSSCSGSFGEEILHYDPAQEQQEQQTQMLRVMVMAALADGKVDDGERAEINKQYAEIAGLPLPPETLANEIKMAMGSGVDLNDYVASFAANLSGHGKAMMVKLAFHTMSASGELQPGHQKQLKGLAVTLGIPQDQYMTLINQLSNG